MNYFQIDSDRDRTFYIAQQLAPGKSLAALVEDGWRPNEAEVCHLAIQILEILVYLHSLTPPVIHRDIKPQNIIRQPDGQIFLVDFGAVQDTYHYTVTGGSTVVGTYGYMAPEQFRGQSVLSTDLYGLGTTLLFLLTQKSPADLPQRKLKINFSSHVRISNSFANWLDKTIEPISEQRFSSAKEALAVLKGEQTLTNYSYLKKIHKPILCIANVIVLFTGLSLWVSSQNQLNTKPISVETSSSETSPSETASQLSYCSASSGQGDWISWGNQTAVGACGIVNKKFESWGQRIRARRYGRYYINGTNVIEVSCAQLQPFSVAGSGVKVFYKAIDIVRQNGLEGRCVYKVTN